MSAPGPIGILLILIGLVLGYAHYELLGHINEKKWSYCIFHLVLIAAGYIAIGWLRPLLCKLLFVLWSLQAGSRYLGAIITFLLVLFILPALRALVHYLLKNEPAQVLFTLIALAETGAFLAWWWAA